MEEEKQIIPENQQESTSSTTQTTNAKEGALSKRAAVADIGRQIKRMQANLVETINSRGCFSVIAQAELGDIEYLKRVKKALSDEV